MAERVKTTLWRKSSSFEIWRENDLALWKIVILKGGDFLKRKNKRLKFF